MNGGRIGILLYVFSEKLVHTSNTELVPFGLYSFIIMFVFHASEFLEIKSPNLARCWWVIPVSLLLGKLRLGKSWFEASPSKK
jgi:hypothetical protein